MSNQPTFVAIGDVHGHKSKLEAAMASEAYQNASTRLLVGDLVNGTDADNYGCLKLAIESDAVCIQGNHDIAFATLLQLLAEYGQAGQKLTYDEYVKSFGITKRQLQAFMDFYTELNQNLTAAELADFGRSYGQWYRKCPHFVRIGHTYIAHGGWHHMMLNAEQKIHAKPLSPYAVTSSLDEDAAHKVVYGNGLTYKNRPPKAHFLPPKNRLLIVGHHHDRADHAHYIADNVLCIDSGCGKKAENDLTMVVFNQHGEVLETLTF